MTAVCLSDEEWRCEESFVRSLADEVAEMDEEVKKKKRKSRAQSTDGK